MDKSRDIFSFIVFDLVYNILVRIFISIFTKVNCLVVFAFSIWDISKKELRYFPFFLVSGKIFLRLGLSVPEIFGIISFLNLSRPGVFFVKTFQLLIQFFNMVTNQFWFCTYSLVSLNIYFCWWDEWNVLTGYKTKQNCSFKIQDIDFSWWEYYWKGTWREFSSVDNVLFFDLGAGYKAYAIRGNSLSWTLMSCALLCLHVTLNYTF